MYFKKLVGKKCYLSPMDVNDAEKYTAWLNDLEITSYLTLSASLISVEGERKFLENAAMEHHYAIVDSATEELIGNASLADINHLHGTAEIGLFIGKKDCWGKGYGTEVMELLLDYGFAKLNLHNITLHVYSFNERAIRCYEKVGFKPAGRLREAFTLNRKKHDILIMDILPDEFYDIYKG